MTKSVIFLAALAIVTAQQTPAPASGVAHGEPINVVFKAVSQAEVFRPTTGKPGTWPGIVLVSDDTGLDDFLRARALNFASKGFLVVAVDTRPATPASMSEELRNKRVIEELGGAVSYLNSWMITPNRVAIVGYGTGGTLALNFALADDSVRAVVLNYAPMRVESPGVTEAHFALLANLGDLDPSTPTTQTAQAIAKLHALRVTTTVKRYPDAGHRFDRDGEAAYDAHDANDQQTRTIDFISNHLGQANSH
jgi:carboxymethylenebutenolidase